MAQQVKILAAKSDDLNLLSRAHMEKITQLLQVFPSSKQICCSMYPLAQSNETDMGSVLSVL